jgi:glyoxylase-like metal-dependent hydrolase (beta-lactamase superfamily II)
MRFIFEQIRTGGDRNFAYLLGDREAGEGALVDPSYDPDAVVERSRLQGLKVTHVINTHGHPDHVNGNARALELTGARLAAYKDAESGPAVALDDGDELKVGALTLRFLYTPGHCSDHLVVYLPDQAVALTGDLLFVGKIGGTASEELALLEYESIQRVLRELPPETTIWPGHDYGCRPSSTIGLELETNPFILAGSVEEFLRLKRDWGEFKTSHGLR